jgi:hypothetical protein
LEGEEGSLEIVRIGLYVGGLSKGGRMVVG